MSRDLCLRYRRNRHLLSLGARVPPLCCERSHVRDNPLRTSTVFICARQPDTFIIRPRDTKTMRCLFFVVVTRVFHYAISIIGAPAERMLRDRVRVADTRDVTRVCKDRESARTKHTPDFDRCCRGRFDRSGT